MTLAEFLENPDIFLGQIKECLAPGGLLAISVPNPGRWMPGGLRENWDYPPHHLTRWNSEALQIFLEKYGFQVRKILYEKIEKFVISLIFLFYSLIFLLISLL